MRFWPAWCRSTNPADPLQCPSPSRRATKRNAEATKRPRHRRLQFQALSPRLPLKGSSGGSSGGSTPPPAPVVVDPLVINTSAQFTQMALGTYGIVEQSGQLVSNSLFSENQQKSVTVGNWTYVVYGRVASGNGGNILGTPLRWTIEKSTDQQSWDVALADNSNSSYQPPALLEVGPNRLGVLSSGVNMSGLYYREYTVDQATGTLSAVAGAGRTVTTSTAARFAGVCDPATGNLLTFYWNPSAGKTYTQRRMGGNWESAQEFCQQPGSKDVVYYHFNYRDGRLHFAYLQDFTYVNVRYLKSDNFGATWQNAAGQNVARGFRAGQENSTLISAFTGSSGQYLRSMNVDRFGDAHFAFSGPGMHGGWYARVERATGAVRRVKLFDTAGLQGVAVDDRGAASTIYYFVLPGMNSSAIQYRASLDGGKTWSAVGSVALPFMKNADGTSAKLGIFPWNVGRELENGGVQLVFQTWDMSSGAATTNNPASARIMTARLQLTGNVAPVLATIADDTVFEETAYDVDLRAYDPNGDAVSLMAYVEALDAASLAGRAYRLDLDLDLDLDAGGDYFNYSGQNERWLRIGNSQAPLTDAAGRAIARTSDYIYIRPNGDVVHWVHGDQQGAGTRIATLDDTYYNDLAQLFDADYAAEVNVPASARVEGRHLTVTPGAGFSGRLQVTVEASDGRLASSDSFLLNVLDVDNRPPVIGAIADITIPRGGTHVLDLPVSDPEGDSLTITAVTPTVDPNTLGRLAYELDRRFVLSSSQTGKPATSSLGEKWLRITSTASTFTLPDGTTIARTSDWLYILSNGEVYHWRGGKGAISGTKVATLSSAFYANTALLHSAPVVPQFTVPATLTLTGNQLRIAAASGYTGTFEVTVTAHDGQHQTVRKFRVYVS